MNNIVWHPARGSPVLISDMDLKHLQNVVRYVKRCKAGTTFNGKTKGELITAFNLEIIKRKKQFIKHENTQ